MFVYILAVTCCFEVIFAARRYASAVYAVHLSVRPSVDSGLPRNVAFANGCSRFIFVHFSIRL